MEYGVRIRRWGLAVVALLTWFVAMAAPLTPDGLALLEFRNRLTVTSPLLESWNASHASPCSWGGVTCTGGGRVRSIALSMQVPMLEGNISTTLGNLNFLEDLVLDLNLLSGSVPSELGNLGSLRTLVLSSNRLTGPIPPRLGDCRNLVQLWLDGNMLSGGIPESLGGLKYLGSLNLNSNLLTGEIPLALQLSFAGMANFSHFDIGSNLFSNSLPPLTYKNLAMLNYDVSSNNFSGDITTALDDMSKLPAIEHISMEGNSFTGTLPPSIGNATTLYYLNLGTSGNGAILGLGQKGGGFGGQIPKEIGKLVNLNTLQLGNNNFTGDIPLEFWNMTSLVYLDIGQTNMRGDVPPEIANLRLLNMLLLWGNKLNGTIPSSVGKLVNLTWLEFTNNSIMGPIPNSFTSLTNLKTLSVGYNNLTGSIPINLSRTLTSMEQIYFNDNALSGPILHDFGLFMPNLTEFGFSNNLFNGTLPDGLCKGGKLNYLVVHHNNLQGAIPLSLAKCSSLTYVHISNNWFTSIPNGFGSNSSIQYLDVSRNQLKGQLPMGLGTNSQLAYLDLSENMLTGDISALEFPQLAQNLSILKLAKNNFTGEIPAAMAVCKLLFQVDLSYNILTGALPLIIANLSNLQELYLQGNKLRAFHPSIYSSFSITLRILNLAENPWNAPIVTEIGLLQALQVLNLSYGQYLGPIPLALGQLTQLEVLDLSYNNLTGEVPHELGESMISLTSVNVSFNRLTGSLPRAWVKFLLANPNSFYGNPGLCLKYDVNNLCITSLSERARAKFRLSVKAIVGIILGAILALALVVGLVVFVVFYFLRHGPLQEEMLAKPDEGEEEDSEISNLTSKPWMFTFEEIMKATENLSDKYVIGRGGHGVVYKVECASHTRPSIVVKKVEFTNKTKVLHHKSFWSEVRTAGKARHRNLVRLLGFIKRDEAGLLLYDYISNGDLHSALHKTKFGCKLHLTWQVRLHIARGVGHGLAYLHHDYDTPIVHRDIKSSNVLLDDDLEAHISDFGLAKVLSMQRPESKPWLSTQNVFGTHGYIAPEVAYGVAAMPQADVYSYGVLLLELLTGKEAINGKEAVNDSSYGKESHVVAWVKEVIDLNMGKVNKSVLDPSLLHPKNFFDISQMLFVLDIALLCTQEKPSQRPTMRNVTIMLKTFSHTIEKRNGDIANGNRGEAKSNNKLEERCNENGCNHHEGTILEI